MDARDLLWASGRDEEVQVNQRALIDKVLARYSGEHTVLRELLQNSDDAGAKTVEIHFNTTAFLEQTKPNAPYPNLDPSASAPKLPDITKELLHQWEFRNDGVPFREEDWNRLKKIAEGNPDEEKIGAFGVGFYSLFSITDEPFVTSGSQWMGFYWKDNKDQLFARRGTLPPVENASITEASRATSNPWTTFSMPLREASTFPARPIDIARFLATSLTFMRNLCDVSMFFDEHQLVRVTKSAGSHRSLPLPGNLNPRSGIEGTMVVREVQSSDFHIQARILRWVYASGTEKPPPVPRIIEAVTKFSGGGGFFSSLISSLAGPSVPTPAPTASMIPEPDLLEALESSVVLTIYSARVETMFDRRTTTELERATKKKPPSVCWYSLIFAGKDEFDASKEEDLKEYKSTGSVFQGLRADMEGSGSARVFIGHATSQSTGIGGHVSARFIPTVERESIDLVDRQVSKWNLELLWIGGYLARFIYESQLSSIRALWDASFDPTRDDLPQATKEWLEAKVLHTLRFFTFYPTTPSALVGINMEQAFFNCAKDPKSFPIISTAGIKPASMVRWFSPEFSSFMKKLPMIPESIAKNATPMLATLRKRGVIRDLTLDDVINELGRTPLSEEEMIECLKWRIGLDTAEVQAHNEKLRRQFLQVAVLMMREGGEDKTIPLSTIRTFLSTSNVIPPNCPLPQHTLPFSVSKHFKADSLKQFFAWTDLTLPEWVEYLLSPTSTFPPDARLTESTVFAERVLGIIARPWGNLPRRQINKIVELLGNQPVIPTRSGLCKPQEAYFLNANIFPDLPIIEMPKGTPVEGNLEKLLITLGVRKHVDLQVVFNRMISTGDWGVHDLMKYLVAVRGSLSDAEIERLQHSAAFPQEGEGEGCMQRREPSELYEPTETMRELGLPLLDWGKEPKWRSNSDEAKLLFELGLRKFPPITKILALASGDNVAVRRKALSYFLENFGTKYANEYSIKKFQQVAFVPAVKADGTAFLSKPGEAFIEPQCAVMGFSLIEPSLRMDARAKLRLPRDPPASQVLATLLKNPPREPIKGREYFEYLTNRIADFTRDQFQLLQGRAIIPARSPDLKDSDEWSMCKPGECFFKNERTTPDIHAKLFTFVDYGYRANNFLRVCGVRDEPGVQEVAGMMVKDPERFFELAGGTDGYRDQLRQVAMHQSWPSSLLSTMKQAPFLLASQKVRKSSEDPSTTTTGDDLEEGEYEYVPYLLKPSQVVIQDDVTALSLFRDVIFGAPEDGILEAFYHKLGVRQLSSLISDEWQPLQVEIVETPSARKTRHLVIERFPLFVDERISRSRVKADWLSVGNHFVVRSCGRLIHSRTLDFGGRRITKVQNVSASSEVTWSFGSIKQLILHISEVETLDLFEVAHSICRELLQDPKKDDSTSFDTILSKDLSALQRRGYNPSRIRNLQRAERNLKSARQAEAEAMMEQQSMPGADPFREPTPPPRLPSQPSSYAEKLEDLKKDDSLPFDTVLSKDLPALQRGGYNNNRILNLQRAERDLQSARQAAAKAEAMTEQQLMSGAHPFREPTPSRLPSQPSWYADKQEGGSGSSTPSWLNVAPSIGAPPAVAGRPMRSESNETLSSLKSRLVIRSQPATGVTQITCDGEETSPQDIERNIRTAINACRSENSSVLRNRQQMTYVKESLESGYCDVSARDGEFELIENVHGYTFYIASDIPNPQQVALGKQAVIGRFASEVVAPLQGVYKLPPSSLHIFYDTKGGLIAFNKRGGIFLNLRYYESWHDKDESSLSVVWMDANKEFVQAGQSTVALISWYHSIAHEIAHNLVQPHNAEHEFYFSALCESHLVAFTRVLNRVLN